MYCCTSIRPWLDGFFHPVTVRLLSCCLVRCGAVWRGMVWGGVVWCWTFRMRLALCRGLCKKVGRVSCCRTSVSIPYVTPTSVCPQHTRGEAFFFRNAFREPSFNVAARLLFRLELFVGGRENRKQENRRGAKRRENTVGRWWCVFLNERSHTLVCFLSKMPYMRVSRGN